MGNYIEPRQGDTTTNDTIRRRKTLFAHKIMCNIVHRYTYIRI